MGIKIFDVKKLSKVDQEAHGILRDAAMSSSAPIPDRLGILCGMPMGEKTYRLLAASSEEYLGGGHGNDATIVFGRDRPNMLMGTGYGPKGALKAASIDIVVGRNASVNDGEGPKQGSYINPSFRADAARIHISQTTDIDKNFGLASSPNGIKSQYGRSGIGIKADGVRIIGREGIRIVTGRDSNDSEGPETNSKGMKLPVAPKIELNAGNYSGVGSEKGMLQGIGKGDNLIKCLDEFSSILDRILGVLDNFMFLQTHFNSQLGVNIWHPHYPTAMGVTVTQTLESSYQKIHPLRARIRTEWKGKYLDPKTAGKNYIASQNVLST